ncbi:MAG: methionyl-tRNA formyltransferase [Flavobacteriales bacterium]|nr:methionyl-tRNA formyltransferase [Flavobacteriales bacterium]|tara:strand:+ start:168 stop:770 length:603 start_codon:yes stop_codon:yes gene_type:complete
MQYNTRRDSLIIPEYGRHVQNMINHAKSIKDKQEQQKCVEAIISFMGQMNPHLRDVKEFTHKLWDHLHIMANFELEIDSEYEKPKKEKLKEKPKRMNYPKNNIKFSYYGNTIPKMIEVAINMEGTEKEIITGMIANQMKKSYILFNESSVDNNTIKLHLKQLSNNRLTLSEDFEFIRSSSIRQGGSNKKYSQRKKFKKKK